MGLHLTKRTKSDFVDFHWITLSLDWSAQMRWDKNHGIEDFNNIIVKNVCYHEFNYGLVFLIFLIRLLHFYWHTLYNCCLVMCLYKCTLTKWAYCYYINWLNMRFKIKYIMLSWSCYQWLCSSLSWPTKVNIFSGLWFSHVLLPTEQTISM